MKCRLCGRGPFAVKGWLQRMNKKGVEGIYECRPGCDARLTPDQAVLGAIEGSHKEPKNG